MTDRLIILEYNGQEVIVSSSWWESYKQSFLDFSIPEKYLPKVICIEPVNDGASDRE